MAEVYHMGVAPHNPLGPVANAVALHFALSTPNFLIQEDMLTDVPWRWDVVQTEITSQNGYWNVPVKPGLGIEINEEEAKKKKSIRSNRKSFIPIPSEMKTMLYWTGKKQTE